MRRYDETMTVEMPAYLVDCIEKLYGTEIRSGWQMIDAINELIDKAKDNSECTQGWR